jgi:hypothetical protein
MAPFSPRDVSSWRDVVAGMFLSLGLVVIGRRWYARSRGTGKPSKSDDKLLMAPAILLLAAGAAMIGTSRMEAQARLNGGNLYLAHANGDLAGTVTVQVSREYKDILLHLTPPRRPNFVPRPQVPPQPKK